MKSRTYTVILTVVMTAFLLVWAEPSRSKEALEKIERVLLVDCPFPPFVIEEDGRAVGGITVDILEEIFRRLGVKLDIELYPWKRVLKMAEMGRADGVTFLLYNDERNRYLAFSDVVMQSRETIFFRPAAVGSFEWSDFADLKPYTIGLVDSYVYGGDFLEVVKKYGLEVEYAQSSEENMTKLNGGRVDLVLEDENVARALIISQGWSKRIRATLHAVSVTDYRMAFSRKSRAQSLLPEVNRVINEMKQDGTIDRILGNPD